MTHILVWCKNCIDLLATEIYLTRAIRKQSKMMARYIFFIEKIISSSCKMDHYIQE